MAREIVVYMPRMNLRQAERFAEIYSRTTGPLPLHVTLRGRVSVHVPPSQWHRVPEFFSKAVAVRRAVNFLSV